MAVDPFSTNARQLPAAQESLRTEAARLFPETPAVDTGTSLVPNPANQTRQLAAQALLAAPAPLSATTPAPPAVETPAEPPQEPKLTEYASMVPPTDEQPAEREVGVLF